MGALSLTSFFANGQEVGGYLGFGSAHGSSTGARIDTYGDGTLYKSPTLGGTFAHIGAAVFFKKSVGVGGEIAWKPSAQDYAGIPYRPTFYTFDAIYRPDAGAGRHFVPEVRAGLGGARLHFFPQDDLACAQVVGCPSSHHFQVHLGLAARWYWSDHFFLRPAFDLHHVDHLIEFGSNWVPQYSVGVGYSLGRE
jgi:hypothetical protein